MLMLLCLKFILQIAVKVQKTFLEDNTFFTLQKVKAREEKKPFQKMKRFFRKD